MLSQEDTRITYQKRIESAEERAHFYFQSHPEILNDIKDLCRYGLEVISWAHEYDYRGVPCNGYWTSVDIGIKLVEYGIDHYGGYDNFIEFQDLLKVFKKGVRYIKRLRETTQASRFNGRNRLQLSDNDSCLMAESFADYMKSGEAIDHFLSKNVGFFFPLPERMLFQLGHYFLPIIAARNLWSSLKCLFSSDARKLHIRKLFHNLTMDEIKHVDLATDTWLSKRYSPLAVNGILHPTIAKTIFIPTQNNFILKCDPNEQTCDLIISDDEKESSEFSSEKIGEVRCRLLFDQNKNRPPDGSLILQTHGGGFIIGTPDTHELYTRYWMNQMPGVAMIMVDIDVYPKSQFPVGLQQMLDVYLWCFSREAEDVIGYPIKKIACVGDSSGGLMSLALINVLNDIRKRCPEASSGEERLFQMPVGLLGVYPSFSLEPRVTPSLLFTAFRPDLSPTIFANMVSAYVPMRNRDINNNWGTGDGEIEREKENSKSFWEYFKDWIQIPSSSSGLSPSTSDSMESNNKIQLNDNYGKERSDKRVFWWNQSSKFTKDFLDDWKLLVHPYVSPLVYGDFASSSKNMKLSLIVVPTDPIADHAIALAQKWKGPVNIILEDDLIHGYLPFVFLRFKFADANDRVVVELKKLIDY